MSGASSTGRERLLRDAATPIEAHLLHFWRTGFDEYVALIDAGRVDHHVRLCREVFAPVICAVIADHPQTGTPVVFDGDVLLPTPAAMTAYDQMANDGRVRALFVGESDEARSWPTTRRGRAPGSPTGPG